MGIVLAAVDNGRVTDPVLEVSLALADLLGAGVQRVSISDDRHERVEPSWAEAGARFGVVEPHGLALVEAIASNHVVGAVFAGSAGDGFPTSEAALDAMRYTNKPVVVVPAAMRTRGRQSFRRLLVPLAGDQRSSGPVDRFVRGAAVEGLDVVVLHVFTPATAPRMLDRPYYDLSTWGEAFVRRSLSGTGQSVDLRTGATAPRIVEQCREEVADVVVLAWSHDLSAGHAMVVREVLARSEIPILLLAAGPDVDPSIGSGDERALDLRLEQRQAERSPSPVRA